MTGFRNPSRNPVIAHKGHPAQEGNPASFASRSRASNQLAMSGQVSGALETHETRLCTKCVAAASQEELGIERQSPLTVLSWRRRSRSIDKTEEEEEEEFISTK